MKKETYENHFNELVALINKNNNATTFKKDERVNEAFDDLSQSLKLSHNAVALLVWALNNMDGNLVNPAVIASQINCSEESVNFSITELQQHHYLVMVDEYNEALDVTAETKELIINHYCFYKLLNS